MGQGRSPAYGDGLAFWALAEMVRRRASIAETDGPALARERLAAMAADYLPDVEERERVEPRLELLSGFTWVVPDRPLHEEIARVLAAGYVRGADCWHLASALYLAEDAAAISFLTLDERQAAVAKILGFRR